jgi:hypothetical protein
MTHKTKEEIIQWLKQWYRDNDQIIPVSQVAQTELLSDFQDQFAQPQQAPTEGISEEELDKEAYISFLESDSSILGECLPAYLDGYKANPSHSQNSVPEQSAKEVPVPMYSMEDMQKCWETSMGDVCSFEYFINSLTNKYKEQ